MAVSVHRGHSPEIHVANLKGVGTGHVEHPIAWSEIVVDTGVNVHLTQAEVLVGRQFEDDVVAGGWRRPVERWLGVTREVIAGLVPNGQAVSRGGQRHAGGGRTAAPFVRDGEHGGIAGGVGFG